MGGGGGIGGALGGIMGGVGSLLQTFAPLANLVLPGFGPMIANAAGGLLQGAGGFMSKMDEEKQDQKNLDAKEAFNHQAAQNDMAGAENIVGGLVNNVVGGAAQGVLGGVLGGL